MKRFIGSLWFLAWTAFCFLCGTVWGWGQGYEQGLRGLVRTWGLLCLCLFVCSIAQAQTCTVTFPDIFNIDPAGGAQIGGAILLLWGFAFACRLVVRALLEVDGSATSDSGE
jgi:hypothetical protein